MEFRCLCLCNEEEQLVLRQGMEEFAHRTHRCVTPEWYQRREDLIYRTRSGGYDTVIVALPGALGMEAVLGVRERAPAIPLVWCSDDDVFALQSYRMKVTAFLRLPLQSEILVTALIQCTQV
ncbi:MAG: hypothetical protein RR315_01705 [Oscillospiraceae bacterium]